MPPIDPSTGFPVREIRESNDDLVNLLILAGIAVAIMGLVSILLGWWIAGRVLRPVRTMTETLRRISARNLHQRLGVTGRQSEIKAIATAHNATMNVQARRSGGLLIDVTFPSVVPNPAGVREISEPQQVAL